MYTFVLILFLSIHSINAHTGCETEGLELLSKHAKEKMIILESVDLPNPHINSITCDQPWDQIIGIATLIHESVHDWDSQESSADQHTFHLSNGNKISLKLSKNYLPKHIIIELLNSFEKQNGRFAENYITGQSGSQGFISLLDEINAYTHSLETRILLPRLKVSTSEAAGLLASIDFLIKYYIVSENNYPEFFSDTLMKPETLIVVRTLLQQAFEQLAESKHLDDVNLYRSEWENILQQPENQKTLQSILK